MFYPKINSLWKREGYDFDKTGIKPNGKNLIKGSYSCDEFANIINWRVFEKIDGTNIRIIYKDGNITFGGRTADSQIPCHLLEYLQSTFNESIMNKAFPPTDNQGNPDILFKYPNIVLFGEGYGPKIQKGGGNYRSDVGFILFDVWANGWWLKDDDVKSIAEQLLILIVPEISQGTMIKEDIIEFVKSKPLSLASVVPQMMEGVVCKSEPLMIFRNGEPIKFKLKCKDFLFDTPCHNKIKDTVTFKRYKPLKPPEPNSEDYKMWDDWCKRQRFNFALEMLNGLNLN